MPGLRLHHPTLRSCTYLLWEPGHRHPAAQGGYRKPKMRPLLIDAEGDTIVSVTVWHRLRAAGASGRITDEFILMNEVPDPPKLAVGHTAQQPQPVMQRQINDAIRQLAPGVASFSIVPSNKYLPPLTNKKD